MAEVDRATGRLLDTVARLTDRDLAGPSLLPGWTRGHVLTHLARNADALTNLLTWARTGIPTPAYPSREKRDADIEAGSGRPLREQAADLRQAAGRFADTAAEMPGEAWAFALPLERPQPAAMVVWRRLREVEVHHVDLDAGYRPADWPDSFSHRLLHEVATDLRDFKVTLDPVDLGHPLGLSTGSPTVTGPAYALAGWLSGRTPGVELSVEPAGPLPQPPSWL
jgi:maleylpyruvate isomerase